MIMILFVKLVTYLFVCKVEGDVRSDEESGPEEEKAEINKVDGVLDNKKKLQWRTVSSPVILKERALHYISINLLFFLRSDANGKCLDIWQSSNVFLVFSQEKDFVVCLKFTLWVFYFVKPKLLNLKEK